MDPHNIVATGLPRSGTTLTCHLLNKLPETIALHEPMDTGALCALGSKLAICDAIDAFFISTRASLLSTRTATSRSVGGQVPDNHVPDQPNLPSGLRKGDAPLAEVTFDKPLRPDFLLIVKHPVLFSGMLEELVPRFRCYAVIRNPLAVLGSWNSVAMPVQDGRAPNAERLNPALRAALDAIPDRLDRQIFLLSWFFAAYERALPAAHILRYEDTVNSGGQSLAPITPAARTLHEPLQSKNASRVYNPELTPTLGAKLLASDGAFWNFYTRESVEMLLQPA